MTGLILNHEVSVDLWMYNNIDIYGINYLKIK